MLAATAAGQTTITVNHPETGEPTKYTLKPHPRVWADGEGGALIEALKDPDGRGSRRNSRLSSPAGLAIQQRIPRLGDGANAAGNNALLAALWWWMDNNASKSGIGSIRDYAISKFNKVVDFHYTGGCDPSADCGDIFNDYAGEWLTDWANAYSLMRSELSSAERQSFANAMLNGINEPCEYRVERLGTVNITPSTTLIGTGTNFDSTLVGREIFVKSPDNSNYAWRRVASVHSSTQLAVGQAFTSRQTGWHIFVLKPWTATSCGMAFFAATHGDTPPYVGKIAQTTLSAAAIAGTNPPPLGGFADTIRVPVANWNPVGYMPFLIRVSGSFSSTGETMLVTGVDGNTLTVRRGEWGNTRAHASGALVFGYTVRANISVAAQIGFGMNNRVLTRQAGFLNIAMALADDDPRARALLPDAINWFRENGYLGARKFHTILNISAVDYGSGRIMGHYSSIALTLKNSLSPSYNVATGEYLTNFMGKFFQYMAAPWDDGLFPRYGLEGGCGPNLMYCIPGKFIGPLMSFGLLPAAQAQATWYQYKTRTNIVGGRLNATALTGDGAVSGINTHYPMLLFDIDNAPQFDFTRTYPTAIATVAGDADPTRGLGAFVSKQDWSKNATALWGLFPHYWTDKQPSSDGLHTYMVGKKGMLIDNTDYQPGSFASTYADQQTVDFGPAYKGPTSAVQGSSMLQQIDRDKVASDYFYARVNALPATNPFHNVTRFYRHFVHLKRAGQQDAIVVYDDVAKTTPERIRSFIHYVNNGQSGEGISALDPTGSYMESRHSQAKLFSHFLMPESGATPKIYDLGVSIQNGHPVIGADCTGQAPCRVRLGAEVHSYREPSKFTGAGSGTVMLYADFQGALKAVYTGLSGGVCGGQLECVGETAVANFPNDAAVRLARLTYTNGVLAAAQCPGPLARERSAAAIDWGTCAHRGSRSRVAFMDADTTAVAGFFAVHQATENLAATPSPTVILSSLDAAFDKRFTGVQIGGPSPAAVLIARGGVSQSGVARFTLTYSGEGQVVVAGLTAGIYTIVRDSSEIGTRRVERDGTLSFTAGAGVFEVRYAGAPPVAINTIDLPPATLGMEYRAELAASGGSTPYQWSLESGNLPPGLNLSPDGTITGTPESAGQFMFTVRVTDSSDPPQTDVRPLVLRAGGGLAISTLILPAANVGLPYEAELRAVGGVPPYSWSMVSGEFPPGITLVAVTGQFMGTTVEAGSYDFVVSVTDSADPPAIARRYMSIDVVGLDAPPLTITTDSLEAATEGIDYSATLTATAGVPPYSWAESPVSETGLPPGMTLSSEGVLAGAPTAAGIWKFEVTVTDSNQPPRSATRQLSLEVMPAAGLERSPRRQQPVNQ